MNIQTVSRTVAQLFIGTALLVAFMLSFAAPSVAQASEPQLSTNKADYQPGETVTIFGSFFASLQNVVLALVGQSEDGDEVVNATWDVVADDMGSFTTTYDLPNFYVPLYLLAANSTTGEILAETTFTDANMVVTVEGAGTGSGTITATNISCTSTAGVESGDCGQNYGGNPATTVLTATPAVGSVFNGWSGSGFTCAGTGTCSLSTTGTLVVTVTATFTQTVVKTNPTLSISNSPQTYTGSPIAATVSGSVAGTVSDVKYGGSATVPTNAGTYAVTADFAPSNTTLYNNLNDASAGSFTIDPAGSVTTVSCPASVVYTASAQTPCTANVTGVGGLNQSLTVDYTDNTDVGVAEASADFAGDTNHTGSSDTENFDIDPADADCSIVGFSGPYDTLSHGASGTCTGVGSDGVLSGLDLGDSFTDVPGGNADWSFSNDNYESENGTVAITITSVNASCTVIGYDVTYDGDAHTADGECLGVGAVVLGGLDLTNTTHTNAGSYLDDSWSFEGGVNYNDANGVVDNNISKADAGCDIDGYTGEYDASEHGATGVCDGVGSDVTPSGLDLGDSFTNVPGGTASWSFTNANYTYQGGDVAIVITEATPDCVVTGYEVTYDATSHTADGECTGVEGEVLDGLDLSGTTHTNAGTYNDDIWVFTDVTGNYTDANSVVDNKINKADAVCDVDGYSVTYDTNPHTATGSCVGVEDEVLAGLDLTGTTHTDAGSYPTDPWTFTDVTGNYNNDAGTVADTIDQASQAITFPVPGNQIFGVTFASNATADSGLVVSLASLDANCVIDGLNIKVTGPVGNSCQITAAQAGNGNYLAASSVVRTFTILPYGTNTTLPPINLVKKDFQKMSTIPVKFAIASSIDGSPVSWAKAKLDVSTNPAGTWTKAVSSGTSNDDNNFRYSAPQYIFNLSTKMPIFVKGNSYTLRITLDSGETITQVLNIK